MSRLTTLLAALVLAVGLVACGGGSDDAEPAECESSGDDLGTPGHRHGGHQCEHDRGAGQARDQTGDHPGPDERERTGRDTNGTGAADGGHVRRWGQ